MAVAAIVGYLLGSIPTALIVARFFRLDPRDLGDGNPGWWNMRRLVGDRPASFVLAGDVLKGVLAAAIGMAIWGDWWWTPYIAVGAAMIGHSFPLFAGFRGGHGILTWAGGMLVISPIAGFAAIALGVASGLLSHRLAWGCRSAFVTFPFLQLLVAPRAWVATTGALMAYIGLRHTYAWAITRRSANANGSPVVPSSS